MQWIYEFKWVPQPMTYIKFANHEWQWTFHKLVYYNEKTGQVIEYEN